MTRDVIADHDRIADHYKYRTPYGAPFFQALAARLGIHDRSTILDLCCGTGAVAAGLAPYCRHIVAVDGAARMIANAPKLGNVSYHVQDINSAAFGEWLDGGSYDFISIGMGIHWLNDAAISGFRSHLRADGRIVILATGFSGAKLNPWLPDYDRLRKSITPKENRDWTGKTILERQGYGLEDIVQRSFRANLPLEYFTDHLLSFSQDHKQVAANRAAISSAMNDCLRKYEKDDRIACCWTSSARIYSDRS
jgi:SAM-dependent methyltransferase